MQIRKVSKYSVLWMKLGTRLCSGIVGKSTSPSSSDGIKIWWAVLSKCSTLFDSGIAPLCSYRSFYAPICLVVTVFKPFFSLESVRLSEQQRLNFACLLENLHGVRRKFDVYLLIGKKIKQLE